MDRETYCRGLLPGFPPGDEVMTIHRRWGRNAAVPRPRDHKLRRMLKAGFEQGLWLRTGLGVARDPFKYYAKKL